MQADNNRLEKVGSALSRVGCIMTVVSFIVLGVVGCLVLLSR